MVCGDGIGMAVSMSTSSHVLFNYVLIQILKGRVNSHPHQPLGPAPLHHQRAVEETDDDAIHAAQTKAALEDLQGGRRALAGDIVFIVDVSPSTTNAGCNNIGQYNARIIRFMQATISTYGRYRPLRGEGGKGG